MACGILVSQAGIEPMPLAVKAQSPNHWTSKEFQNSFYFKKLKIPKKNILMSVTSLLDSTKPCTVLDRKWLINFLWFNSDLTGDTRGQSPIHQDTKL